MYHYSHHSHAARGDRPRASWWNRTLTRFAADFDSTRLRSPFQSPQAGHEETVLLPHPEGKETHSTRHGQVNMHVRWRCPSLLDSLQWELWELARLLASLLNPLRNPSSVVVAVVMTFLEEIGAPATWTQLLFTLLANLASLQVVTWLIGEVAISAIVTCEQWWLRLARRAHRGASRHHLASRPCSKAPGSP